MGRSRSPRKRSERKRSRSRERKRRRRSVSSSSDSDHHKRRRDKKSSGHRRRSRSRSHERHSKRKRYRSRERHRKRSESPVSQPPEKEKADGKKDAKEDPTSNLTGAEKVRARLKMLLGQQDKKRKEEEEVKLERIVTVPTSKQIASIDKEGFHQQQFKSAARVTTTKDKHSSKAAPFPAVSISEQDHDSAIFGGTISNVSKPLEEEKPQPMIVSTTQLSSSDKKARWLEKLNQMRSKYSKPPSDEPTESLT